MYIYIVGNVTRSMCKYPDHRGVHRIRTVTGINRLHKKITTLNIVQIISPKNYSTIAWSMVHAILTSSLVAEKQRLQVRQGSNLFGHSVK